MSKTSLVLPLLLASCVAFFPACGTKDSSLDSSLARLYLAAPRPESFRVCWSFGCRITAPAGFTPEEWDGVRALFDPAPADAAGERQAVRRAVALMETLVGNKVGTFDDQPENEGTGRGTTQLDCVAEAMNTSVFLVLLQDDGLLRFHSVGRTEKRGWGIFSPHNTAVLVQKDDGRAWAVDSWFHANGAPPEVVDLESWLDGYEPE